MRLVFLATNKHAANFGQDPSYIYRCENLGHALRHRGIEVTFDHFRHWRPRGETTCVVLHRPKASFSLWRLVKRLQRDGTKIVADVDDLVFDVALARFNPGVHNGRVPLRRIEHLYRLHREALKWVDHITVSTNALKNEVHRCFPDKPVTIVQNAVFWDWQHNHMEETRLNRDRIITYFPGTASHDRDFARIAPVITEFLRGKPAIGLRVTGKLTTALKANGEQVAFEQKVPFGSYAERVSQSWVNLAPLEHTPFNACKSALKAIEAGFFGVPTICSPNADYERFELAGALVARTEQDWSNCLEKLLDEDFYRTLTNDLRKRTLALADIRGQATTFLEQVVGTKALHRYSGE